MNRALRPTRSVTRAGLAAGALLCAAVPAAAQQREHFSLGSGDVAAYALAGAVRVVGTSGGEVTADVVREGADAAKLTVETGDVDGRRTLRVIFPGDEIRFPDMGRNSRTRIRVRRDGTFGDDNHGGGFFSGREVTISGSEGLDARATVTLGVPAGRTVAVHVGAGVATVTNVNGRVTVRAHAASVTTSGTRGSLTLDTGSGEVQVSDAQGDVNLDTGSGGATVRGVRGGRLNVDAGSGRLRIDGVDATDVSLDLGSGGAELTGVRTPSLSIDSGSGDVSVDLRSDVRSLKVDSGSGSIRLRVPSALGAEIEIDAGSGGYTVDVPVTVTKRSSSRLTGRIGDGDGHISIDSGSGSVRILKGA